MSESKRSFVWLSELLEDPDMLKPPLAVAPRLAWPNRVTLLAAREKGGKSTLAGAAAAAVSRGRPFLGAPSIHGNVLIVALEEHPQEFVQRLVRFGADPAKVAFVSGGNGDLVKTIRAAASEIQPSLIILDTLGAFAENISPEPLTSGDSFGWTRVMLEVVGIARDYGATIVLHHSNKSDGKYRDSTAIGANVDVILEMFGENDQPRILKGKARFPISELRIKLEGDVFELVTTEKEAIEAILAFVREHPRCSARDLVEGVGMKAEMVLKLKNRLLSTHTIVNVGGKKHEYTIGAGAGAGAPFPS